MSNPIAKSDGNISEKKYPFKSTTLQNRRTKIALD